MAEPVTVVLTSNPLTVGRAYPANWNPKPPFVKPPITKASCLADPVSNGQPGSHDGQPSLGHGPEGYLILKCPSHLSKDARETLTSVLTPIAQKQNLQAMVLDGGIDAEVVPANLGGLIAVIAAQCEAINRLAASNEALVQGMAEDGGIDDVGPTGGSQYLGGGTAG